MRLPKFWICTKALPNSRAKSHIDVELLRLPCCDKAYWEAVMVSAAGQMPDVFRIWSTQQTDIYKSGLALDISAKDGAYFKQFRPRLGLGVASTSAMWSSSTISTRTKT